MGFCVHRGLSICKLGTASRAAAGIERSPLPREEKAWLSGIGGVDGNERTTPTEGAPMPRIVTPLVLRPKLTTKSCHEHYVCVIIHVIEGADKFLIA